MAVDQGYANDRIALVGGSAGGGLVVTSMLRLRERDVPLPVCAVTMSPWTDLVGDGGWRNADTSIDPLTAVVGLDEVIAGYLADADPPQGLASPLFAGLTGMPPLLVQVATQDILMSDGTRLADKARQAGIDVKLEIEEDAFHVWHHAAPEVPESTAAIERAGAFIRHQMR